MRVFNLQNRRIKETIILFSLFLVVIITLILPLYKISYDSMKSRINVETEYKINQISEFIDSEIMACHKMKMGLKTSATYNSLKTVKELQHPKQYILLKEFQEDFNGKTNVMSLSDYCYIFFQNNNIAISKKNAFDNIEPLFNGYLKMNNMNYNQFRDYIFGSELGISVQYVEEMELEGEKSPALVIFYPMELYTGAIPDSMVMLIYKIDSLFEKMDMKDYKNIFRYICINDMTILSDGKKADEDRIFVAKCENIDLAIKVEVSDGYLNRQMKGFSTFVFIYFLFFLIAITVMELIADWYANRRIRNMVRYISGIVGDKSIYCEEDIYGIVKQLKNDNDVYNDTLLMSLFLKPLDSAGVRFIKVKYPDFPEPFILVLFYGEIVNKSILELLFEQFEIKWKQILSYKNGEYAVVFDCADKELRNKLNDMVYSMKKGDVSVVAVIGSQCDCIEEFYAMYTRMNEYHRVIDHAGFFELDNAEYEFDYNKIKTEDNNKLKEYIICGQGTEAKRLVCELWYNVMESHGVTNSEIEAMFYGQISILSDVARKINYKKPLAKYDSKIKIDELAFMIIDDIDAVCKMVNEKADNYDEYDGVIKYIDEYFADVNFGIPYVEQKFNITGKTINKIVKSKTGKTFSEYVEQKRLALVKNLMLNSEDEIKIIAEKSGFLNYDTFYKFFKKHTGISPVKWKNMNKHNA